MRESLEDIVTRMYEAVLDPQGWCDVLEYLRRQLGAEAAIEHVWPAPDRPDFSLCMNREPGEMQRYLNHYFRLDPWMGRLSRVPPRTVALGRAFVPDDVYLRSEFYNDFLRPMNLRWFVTVVNEVPPQAVSVMSFLRSPKGPDYGDTDLRLLHHVAPHFGNCIDLQRRVNRLRERVHLFEIALDTIGYGVVLIAPNGAVVHVNERAQIAMRRDPALRVRNARLTAADPRADQRLQRLLTAALGEGGEFMRARPGFMWLGGDTQADRQRLLVAPFRTRRTGGGQALNACVFIAYGPQAASDRVEFLRLVYALTPAEAKCALMLADGTSLERIAEAQGVTRNTVRAHLRELFAKTGTHRQGALVAALNRELSTFDLMVRRA